MIIKIIFIAIIIWALFAIVLPFSILPNFYLRKLKKQKTKYIETTARKLKNQSKEKTLKNVYQYVTKNYTGIKEKYKLINYFKLFQHNVDQNLKHKKQFLACHLQNWLITNLLINTKQFTKKDIKKRTYITRYLTAHQDLIIKTDKGKFHIDPFYKEFDKLK